MTDEGAGMRPGFPPDVPHYGSPYEPFRNPRVRSGPRRTLLNLVEALLPDVGARGFPPAQEIVHHVERYVTFLPRPLRLGFPWTLRMLEFGTFLHGAGFLPFSRMPPERRRHYLRRLMESRIYLVRELLKALKGLVLLACYEHPRVLATMGFDHASHAREMIRRRKEKYGLDVA